MRLADIVVALTDWLLIASGAKPLGSDDTIGAGRLLAGQVPVASPQWTLDVPCKRSSRPPRSPAMFSPRPAEDSNHEPLGICIVTGDWTGRMLS